jgi:pheromone shutdown-related protein TraB
MEAKVQTEERGGYPSDVRVVRLGEREIFVVGTAHVSHESVDLVREVIEREQPDCVCVELDTRRFEALKNESFWENLDLREVIRKRQLATLLVNLVLSSYQKQLGMKLGVTPGSEMMAATRLAEEKGIPVALCDRDVRVTLRRAWNELWFFRKLMLISVIAAGAFEKPELDEEELRRLRQQDVITELMRELGRHFPALKRVLIDERDTYLGEKIRQATGRRMVAVVGAGHLDGMCKALESEREVDLAELEVIPPVHPGWKILGWSIPLAILGSIAFIGWSKGAEAAGESALFWFLANAIPAAIGCALALAHPATIVTAFLAAPFTSMTPLIGAGHVTSFVQAYLQPPLVRELRTATGDMGRLVMWWRSRLLRIFLVLVLTSLGSLIGTWVGGVGIVSNLF